jgi:hypothetical protein
VVFAPSPEPVHDADFLDRLRLPLARRTDGSTWEPKRLPRPTVVPIRDERDVRIDGLERTIGELTERLEVLQDLVDHLHHTLDGLQEDLPPARWRIPTFARSAK